MQRRKTGKISIFSPLDVIFDSLASRVGNPDRVLTRGRYQAGSECWNRVFEPGQKVGTETRPDGQSKKVMMRIMKSS